MLSPEQLLEFRILKESTDLVASRETLAQGLQVFRLGREFLKDFCIIQPALDAVVQLELSLDRILLASNALSGFLVIPQIGSRHFGLQLFELAAKTGYVKDAPGTRRSASVNRGCAR
jgi:hypothetical protein